MASAHNELINIPKKCAIETVLLYFISARNQSFLINIQKNSQKHVFVLEYSHEIRKQSSTSVRDKQITIMKLSSYAH